MCNLKYDGINYSMEATLIYRLIVGDCGLQIYCYFGENWVNAKLSYKDDFQKEIFL